MTTTLLPLPLTAWLARLRSARPAAAAPRDARAEALEDAALRRMLPMMMGNAPHPYQASLLPFLMSEQHRREKP